MSIITSPYANSAADAHLSATRLLVEALDLPHVWRSSDPELGERTGMLMVQGFEDKAGSGIEKSLQCLFVASAAFGSLWDAMRWAVSTGVSLDHAIVRLKLPPAKGVGRLEKSGKITIGNPRSPLKTPNGQTSHVWVVDVMAPVQIILLIGSDRMCGHV